MRAWTILNSIIIVCLDIYVSPWFIHRHCLYSDTRYSPCIHGATAKSIHCFDFHLHHRLLLEDYWVYVHIIAQLMSGTSSSAFDAPHRFSVLEIKKTIMCDWTAYNLKAGSSTQFLFSWHNTNKLINGTTFWLLVLAEFENKICSNGYYYPLGKLWKNLRRAFARSLLPICSKVRG